MIKRHKAERFDSYEEYRKFIEGELPEQFKFLSLVYDEFGLILTYTYYIEAEV